MFVCCVCCVLSGRGLCDELITRLEESYRLWCVVVCDLENLKNEEAMTLLGRNATGKKNITRIAQDFLEHLSFARAFIEIMLTLCVRKVKTQLLWCTVLLNPLNIQYYRPTYL
jgi:hypothetical protein